MMVKCSISDQQKEEMGSINIPLIVQIRMILNQSGFKFIDDRKLSSIMNEKPVPLGTFSYWYDKKNLTTHYKQEISE